MGVTIPVWGPLNTTFQPEPGAPGNAGGGRGGTGSEFTVQSTPRGGSGLGAFGEIDGGGQGGESSYSPTNQVDDRRAAGGGGGVFGNDVFYDHDAIATSAQRKCQTLLGMGFSFSRWFSSSPFFPSTIYLTFLFMFSVSFLGLLVSYLALSWEFLLGCGQLDVAFAQSPNTVC